MAGVSTATVSRALNSPERVSKEIRERVLETVKKVGYRPNQLGASLRTAKSNNIIAVIPDISDSFISGMIKSLRHTATQRGYSVLLGDTGDSRELELAYGDMVRGRQADGIIAFSHRLPFRDEDISLSHFSFPPMINSCERIDTAALELDPLPFVSVDNIQAGRDITQHIIDRGHKKIAVITGDINTPSAKDRLAGYRSALEESGIELEPSLIYEGSYNLEAGISCTLEMLQNKIRPTAIFCMCDETAVGCINTLREQGLDVPNDMSVAGFDGIRVAEHLYPSLTTIEQPTEKIGEYSANLLIDLIEGKTLSAREYILEHKLAIRNSVKLIG